jgi:hypothetical protein
VVVVVVVSIYPLFNGPAAPYLFMVIAYGTGSSSNVV